MARPFMFRDPITAKAGPPKLDIWLEFGQGQILLRARHEGDDYDQNLAALRFDAEDDRLYLESIPLAPKHPKSADSVHNLRMLLGGRLIELQAGTVEDEPVSAATTVDAA